MTKESIRDAMRARRRSVALAERAAVSALVCRRLGEAGLEGPIAVYLASRDEIDLSSFVSESIGRGVRVVAPRWNGRQYELAELNGCWPRGLVAGAHAILEPPPAAPRVDASAVASWIVPGLAFSADGSRLGYGGGWYDRMLADARGDSRKIGVGYGFQLADALPSEPHDMRLDEVLVG